jgi:hypothetical protein
MITAAKRYKKRFSIQEAAREQTPSVNTFGLYSAFLACRAIVFRSKRQSRLTVATMFCKVGTIPLTVGAAPGVAAGVAGASVSFTVVPLSDPVVFCEEPFVALAISDSDGGGVSAAAPPGKESEEGEVKAFACWAVEGCVVSVSIMFK